MVKDMKPLQEILSSYYKDIIADIAAHQSANNDTE